MIESKGKITVKFYGVRGVYPCTKPAYSLYGGDTICTYVCLESCNGDPPVHVIFDAGTGIISLGKHLANQRPAQVFLFFSHLHLDHIMGVPYFAPLWMPEWEVQVYAGPLSGCNKATDYLKQNIAPPLFPVPLADFPGKIVYHDISVFDTIQHARFEVFTFPLNHPGGGIGYGLHAEGKKICHVTDTEHIPGTLDVEILKAVKGADLMIYDSTYTDDTWAPKRGWGHSTWEEGIRLSQAAGVQRLALYHHDHEHTDEILQVIDRRAKEAMPTAFVCRQGMVLKL